MLKWLQFRGWEGAESWLRKNPGFVQTHSIDPETEKYKLVSIYKNWRLFLVDADGTVFWEIPWPEELNSLDKGPKSGKP